MVETYDAPKELDLWCHRVLAQSSVLVAGGSAAQLDEQLARIDRDLAELRGLLPAPQKPPLDQAGEYLNLDEDEKQFQIACMAVAIQLGIWTPTLAREDLERGLTIEREREAIWTRRLATGSAPLEADVDVADLARRFAEIAGGNIRNAVLGAAYLAASEDAAAITHAHLVRAARIEHQAMGHSPRAALRTVPPEQN